MGRARAVGRRGDWHLITLLVRLEVKAARRRVLVNERGPRLLYMLVRWR